ncbi:MAG: hypothetical protein K9G58_01350 [Bacteroidales bacterium]|nr:hypothetical protein [Bacteroidales bacterium]MCF8396781.1 hypothetical protein [Bacteroidales bacterium]
MKKIYQFIILGLLITGMLHSCGQDKKNKQNEGENFQEQMEGFSESMEDIDETMELVDFLNNKLKQIEQKVAEGELSPEEGQYLANELNEKYRREIARRSNLNPATNLPTWAKELGLLEPKGMVLDHDFSKKTSVNNETEGFNSIKLVFKGDYNTALNQARLIAENAGIPMSKEYAKAYEMAEKYPSAREKIKGVSYMNYELGETGLDHKISINVDENGKLTIIAVNEQQRKKYLERVREKS